MKNILISIKPEWVEKILNGEKTIEIRKTMPKCELPCKVYIYETKGKGKFVNCGKKRENIGGKVVAEFTLKYIIRFDIAGLEWWNMKEPILESACLTKKQLEDYIGNKIGYAWRIKDLKIYDKPKKLDTFIIGKVALDCGYGNYNIYNKVLEKAPQSWCYVEGD